MSLSYYLEDQIHDESASLLGDDIPLRGFGGKESALPMGVDPGNVAESGRRVSNNLIEHWKGLTPLSKVAIVITAVVFYFWSGFSGKQPGKPQPDVVGHKKLADLDELKWAEQTFGMFLEDAVPRLENANNMAHHFLNMLPEGQCDAWSAIFAETGKFSFNIPQLKADFTTRKEVRDAFCSNVGKRIVAMKLIWHFPDTERASGIALFEVFTRDAPGAEVQKARWAFFALLGGGGKQIMEYQCYTESVGASLDGPLGAAVSANLRRLNGHDCEGFAGALPGQGTANWVMQSLPLGKSDKDELDDKPQNLLLEKCRRDTEKDWSNIDLQYGSVAGVFLSAYLDEAIIFFHKEKRYKGALDVTDDPEALVVKKAPGPEPRVVNTFYFYFIEAVHLAEEWSWKYGWESTQRGTA